MNNKTNEKILILAILALLGVADSVSAICPVCTVAVAGGVGLARWLGIDDTVTGLWVGALILSVSLWTLNWMNKKNIRFKGDKIMIIAGYYLITVVPLYWSGIIGHTYNKLWGMDKLVMGIVAGSLIFFGSIKWYAKLKEKNDNHAYFPFQKVAMPVGFLAMFSIIFYIITKY